jgi:hypothetical protein
MAPARCFVIPALTTVLGAGVAGVAMYLNGPARPVPPPAAPRYALAPTVPGPSAFAWRLTAATSADRALVLEVETARTGEAVAIAQQLTEPYKDRFDEVLVYFFEPNARPRLAALRVQWTRAQGYRTLTLRAAD